jgi:hypothetical protein
MMTEEATIGRQRAEEVAMLLRGAGLTTPSYTVRWLDEPSKPTGVDDHLARRAVVTVQR